MSTDKMREEFEAWWKSTMNVAVMDLHRNVYPMNQGWSYACHETNRAWMAWQASRAALVVELPPTITVEDAAEAADLEDERAVTVAHMVNGAIAACGSFIKAAGVGVK